MCLVNGWDLIDDLIHAFRATIQILQPGDPDFEAKEIVGVFGRAVQLIGEPRQFSFGERSLRPAEFCRVLVCVLAENKYDLIYGLQALIEHCAVAGNHFALKRERGPRLFGTSGLFPQLDAMALLDAQFASKPVEQKFVIMNEHVAGEIGTAALWQMKGRQSRGVRYPATPKPATPPEPTRDHEWYKARAQERRDRRAARQEQQRQSTAAGKERAGLRV